MFRIEEYDQSSVCKEFELSSGLFHEALREDPSGGSRFHVKNPRGEDFDIDYYDNNDDMEPLDT